MITFAVFSALPLLCFVGAVIICIAREDVRRGVHAQLQSAYPQRRIGRFLFVAGVGISFTCMIISTGRLAYHPIVLREYPELLSGPWAAIGCIGLLTLPLLFGAHLVSPAGRVQTRVLLRNLRRELKSPPAVIGQWGGREFHLRDNAVTGLIVALLIGAILWALAQRPAGASMLVSYGPMIVLLAATAASLWRSGRALQNAPTPEDLHRARLVTLRAREHVAQSGPLRVNLRRRWVADRTTRSLQRDLRAMIGKTGYVTITDDGVVRHHRRRL